MTELDELAKAAMQGIMAAPDSWVVPCEAIATNAYEQAEAMLAERDRRNRPKYAETDAAVPDFDAVGDAIPREAVVADRRQQPTLTDEELEAIAYFSRIEGPQFQDAANLHAKSLRGLMGRLGGQP
jgi:hypothetical protein